MNEKYDISNMASQKLNRQNNSKCKKYIILGENIDTSKCVSKE